MEEQKKVLHHPLIGLVRGVEIGDDVHGIDQYLGIQYAELDSRFSSPEIKEEYRTPLDATRLGSAVPGPSGLDNEFMFIQQALPKPEVDIDERDCLNLNITVPRLEKQSKLLPVVVYLHGGAYLFGANWWPQYGFTAMVKLGLKTMMPFVGINIGYRTGVMGFLTSKELRDAGYEANRGLLDQRTALMWIKKHIAGFGGDPDNVTVVGQSAGAASALMHLSSPIALFERMVIMSGTPRPRPYSTAESTYQSIIRALNIDNLNPSNRVKALLTCPIATLAGQLSAGFLGPIIDNKTVHVPMDFNMLTPDLLPGLSWCKELMVGDCALDANLFFYTSLAKRQKGIAQAFCAHVSTQLFEFPELATAVFGAYDITPGTADGPAFDAVLRFLNDTYFTVPAVSIAETWPGKSYLYHFNEGCPWEGRFKGCATHILDVAFLFQNFNHVLTEAQVAVAECMATDIIGFAYGGEPWAEFKGEKGARVYGPSEAVTAEWVQGVAGEGSGRKDTIWRICEGVEGGLKALQIAAESFTRLGSK